MRYCHICLYERERWQPQSHQQSQKHLEKYSCYKSFVMLEVKLAWIQTCLSISSIPDANPNRNLFPLEEYPTQFSGATGNGSLLTADHSHADDCMAELCLEVTQGQDWEVGLNDGLVTRKSITQNCPSSRVALLEWLFPDLEVNRNQDSCWKGREKIPRQLQQDWHQSSLKVFITPGAKPSSVGTSPPPSRKNQLPKASLLLTLQKQAWWLLKQKEDNTQSFFLLCAV